MEINKIIQGDCLEVLKTFGDESVDMICTSPPYYGLRDYGVDGQLGLEKTLDEYLSKMLLITNELKRVLKKTGTMWWNHGDSYASLGRLGGDIDLDTGMDINRGRGRVLKGSYPEKCMLMQNYRLALKMVDEQGWILRNQIIWHKPNCMPSSVKDRFTVDFEPVFFFSKSKKYWFEMQYEKMDISTIKRTHDFIKNDEHFDKKRHKNQENSGQNPYEILERISRNGLNPLGRNKRCVWKIDSKYQDTLEEALNRQGMNKLRGDGLVEKRDLPPQKEFVDKLRDNFTIDGLAEKTKLPKTQIEHWFRYDSSGFAYPSKDDWQKVKTDLFPELLNVWYETDEIKTNELGRNKRCVWKIPTHPFKDAHFATFPEKLIEPMIKAGCPPNGIVLDCFMGSGTTAYVARKLGRNYLGIELNPAYIKMAERRLSQQVLC